MADYIIAKNCNTWDGRHVLTTFDDNRVEAFYCEECGEQFYLISKTAADKVFDMVPRTPRINQ